MSEQKEKIVQEKQEEEQVQKQQVNTGLVSLDIVAKMNNTDIDMRSVVREYGISTADIEPEEVIRIAKNKGFKVKRKKLKLKDIPTKYPMPAILQMKDNSYIILLAIKHDEGRALTLVPLAKHPESHDFDELQEQIKDEVIILRHKNADSDVKFGFKWFFNEIFKYKQIIGQVLLGSFVVQLFGLVTPLFTQVILDKVLVNRTIATRDVIAVAFIVVAVFELLMN